MSVPLTILIGNKEYNVIGENEKLIRRAADILNEKISDFSIKNPNADTIPILTKTTIAALNVIEEVLHHKDEVDILNSKIVSEIYKITDYIETNINNPHYN